MGSQSMSSPVCVDNKVRMTIQSCSDGTSCGQCTSFGVNEYDPAEFDKFIAGQQCHRFTFIPAQGTASVVKIVRAREASTMFTTNPCAGTAGTGSGQGSSGSGGSSSSSSSSTVMIGVGGGVALVAIGAALLLVKSKKRKKQDAFPAMEMS